MTKYTLIPCPSCTHQMSVDAESCPQCGAHTNWVHPTLERVISYVDTLNRATEFEALGHRLILHTEHQNLRQRIGNWSWKASIVLFILGMFSSAFLVFAMLSLFVGGGLTLFGLSAIDRHELNIDLRTDRKIVGQYDGVFWADVIAILEQSETGAARE